MNEKPKLVIYKHLVYLNRLDKSKEFVEGLFLDLDSNI